MKKCTVFLLALCLFAFNATCSENIPSYVTPCKRHSEDSNQCILNALEALRPNVGEGIPKLKIPPLEPFLLSKMNMSRMSETLEMKVILSQLAITGLTKVMVTNLNVDLTDLSGSVSLEFADLNVTTLYDMDVLIMETIPMIGQGRYEGNISDIRVDLTGKSELSAKDDRGSSYLKLTELKLKMFIGDAAGRMVDTSNIEDNEFLTQTAYEYYENNKRDVLDMVTPIFEEFCESFVLEAANQILSVVPFEEMFH